MSTLVVLAAGLATRYGGAKQLVAVGPAGERLFDYAVFDALRAGCDSVVFVIRPELRAIFEAEVVPLWRTRLRVQLAEQRVADVPAQYVANRQKPWGTVHALLAAAPLTQGSVIVCNADDWYGAGAYAALQQVLASEGMQQSVAGYRLDTTLSEHGGVSRAVCRVDAHGMLQRIEEHDGITRAAATIIDDRGFELAADDLVSMNLWGFQPAFLQELQPAFAEFLEAARQDPGAELRIADVVNQVVQAGRAQVRVVPAGEEWFGMTYTADLPRVREAIAARVRSAAYPESLFLGFGQGRAK